MFDDGEQMAGDLEVTEVCVCLEMVALSFWLWLLVHCAD